MVFTFHSVNEFIVVINYTHIYRSTVKDIDLRAKGPKLLEVGGPSEVIVQPCKLKYGRVVHVFLLVFNDVVYGLKLRHVARKCDV